MRRAGEESDVSIICGWCYLYNEREPPRPRPGTGSDLIQNSAG